MPEEKREDDTSPKYHASHRKKHALEEISRLIRFPKKEIRRDESGGGNNAFPDPMMTGKLY
jgi:hypothetical protein